MDIRTFGDYLFEYDLHGFLYGSMTAAIFQFDPTKVEWYLVKSFKLIEGSNDLSSKLLGKKYNVNVSTSNGKNITIKCKDLATAELIMNVFRENAPKSANKLEIETTSKSILKEKLEEILELKNQGILSEEEYELKRKQIIEKY